MIQMNEIIQQFLHKEWYMCFAVSGDTLVIGEGF